MKVLPALYLAGLACISASSVHAETQWLRDPERRVSFAYDDSRWVLANPAEANTIFVVKWLAKQDKSLIATCYLGAAKSTFAEFVGEAVHANKDLVVEAMMKNLRKRDPEGELVSAEASYADNYEVIHLVRRINFKLLDRSGSATLESLNTVWKKEEIELECGYDDVLRQDPKVQEYVEKHIRDILRSLHFER